MFPVLLVLLAQLGAPPPAGEDGGTLAPEALVDAGVVTDAGLEAAADAGLDVSEAPDAGLAEPLSIPSAVVMPDGRAPPPNPAEPTVATPPSNPEIPTLGRNQTLPKNFTGIVGRVTDAKTGEGLIEATVKVVAGGKKSALTDLEGYYRMKLAPGAYDLRVFYELHEGRRISNVEVKKGEALTLDVALEPDARSVQEVVVEARLDKRNETALVQERKKAAVAQDSLSAAVIAKTPDSNAGDAVKRVVGATLLDNKYVFIRGLGGRYTQTLLNSTLMPSPEPDEPSVPLDLFPVALLSNLNVIKTYSAELPGNFAGGSVTIDTNTFPTKFELAFRAQLSGDTMTTFRARPNEPQSAGEAIGFKDPARVLPGAIPTDVPLQAARTGSPGVSADQQKAAASAFPQKWTPDQTTGLPSGSFGATVGDTLHLGKDVRLGYLLSGQIARRERTQRLHVIVTSLDSGESDFTTTVGSVNGSTSGLANVGLQVGRDHEINSLGLYLTNAETTATEGGGYDRAHQQPVAFSRLQFTQRQLFFNQLKGFHRLPVLFDAEIDWQANFSRVQRDEPDIRDMRYVFNDDGTPQIRLGANSLERFFLSLGEDSGGGTLNLTVPVRTFRFKLGGLGQYSARTFDGRRFRYAAQRLTAEQLSVTPEQLLVPSNFGPPITNATPLTLDETTLDADRYTSSLRVAAGFLTVDWKAADWFRANAGVRLESSRLTLQGGSPFATGVGAPIAPIERNYLDAIPSANLVFSPRADLNVRLAYSYTLARPSFRELAPFAFFDAIRRRSVSGNPDLVETRIHNADARVEWFLGEADVLALTAFGKQFQNPIERIIYSTSSLAGDLGYRNSPGATLLGLELEGRVNLGRFTPVLRPVNAGANFSLIYSRIQIDPSLPSTNTVRALQGQSPYIGNAFVTWTHPTAKTEIGVFYNVYGPRILDVGINGLEDVIEQPFHRLDVSVIQPLPSGFQLKVSAANVLNQAVRLKQGTVEVLSNPPGVQFLATLSWNLDPERKK